MRAQKTKAIVLRFEGSLLIAATGYRMERLRCDTCGEVFTAPVPAAAGPERYAPSVGVTIAVFVSASGFRITGCSATSSACAYCCQL